MPPNNLVRPVTLDTLGASVPIGDNAICVQHVNGVIRDAINEQSEASFALTKARQRLRQLSGALLDALLERIIEPAARLLDFFGRGQINQHIYRANQTP